MYSKVFTTAALAMMAGLASAQTFTDCNPLEKTCSPDPGFGKDGADCDFTKGKCDAFTDLPGTTISYNDKGAVFQIKTEKTAPTIATKNRIFFGRLDVELQASPGVGVVTSVVLESADLDEIDWEWLGGKTEEVQSNYFGKGDTTTYDRGGNHSVSAVTTTFHTYSIDWTKERIQWIIDGNVVRTVTYNDAKGGTRYPQTPMEVKIGTWVAGSSTAQPGTVEWAGGLTDFSQAPFDGIYKSIKITDYAGGDKETDKSVKEYVWSDNSGSYDSIKITEGDGNDDTSSSSASASASATSTKSATSAAATTTSASKTATSAATTLTTVSSSAATSAASSSGTTPSSTQGTNPPAATTSGAPAPSGTNAAAGNVMNLGAVAFAGAAVMAAQLL